MDGGWDLVYETMLVASSTVARPSVTLQVVIKTSGMRLVDQGVIH